MSPWLLIPLSITTIIRRQGAAVTRNRPHETMLVFVLAMAIVPIPVLVCRCCDNPQIIYHWQTNLGIDEQLSWKVTTIKIKIKRTLFMRWGILLKSMSTVCVQVVDFLRMNKSAFFIICIVSCTIYFFHTSLFFTSSFHSSVRHRCSGCC